MKALLTFQGFILYFKHQIKNYEKTISDYSFPYKLFNLCPI